MIFLACVITHTHNGVGLNGSLIVFIVKTLETWPGCLREPNSSALLRSFEKFSNLCYFNSSIPGLASLHCLRDSLSTSFIVQEYNKESHATTGSPCSENALKSSFVVSKIFRNPTDVYFFRVGCAQFAFRYACTIQRLLSYRSLGILFAIWWLASVTVTETFSSGASFLRRALR